MRYWKPCTSIKNYYRNLMNSEGEKLCATVLFIANDPIYVLVRRRVKETKPLSLSCETNTVCWPLYTNSSEARNRMFCATKLWRHSKWRWKGERPIERKNTGQLSLGMHRIPTRPQAAQKIRKRSSFVERKNMLEMCSPWAASGLFISLHLSPVVQDSQEPDAKLQVFLKIVGLLFCVLKWPSSRWWF